MNPFAFGLLVVVFVYVYLAFIVFVGPTEGLSNQLH